MDTTVNQDLSSANYKCLNLDILNKVKHILTQNMLNVIIQIDFLNCNLHNLPVIFAEETGPHNCSGLDANRKRDLIE